MTGMRQRLSVAAKVVVGCISITVGVLLGLWCVVLCVWSFLPSNAGAALPRVDAHFSVQLVLALVGLTIVVLVAVAGFGVTQEGIKRAASVALVLALACLACTGVALGVTASRFLHAPPDPEMGIGSGVTAAMASSWATYFWTLATVAGALAALLAARRVAWARHGDPQPDRPRHGAQSAPH